MTLTAEDIEFPPHKSTYFNSANFAVNKNQHNSTQRNGLRFTKEDVSLLQKFRNVKIEIIYAFVTDFHKFVVGPKSIPTAMIVYHKNQEIDREQWDNCIRNSSCIKPYPYSWYLDIMSPGWEALVDDDYDSVFPVPSAKRFGIQYVKTPSFVQQLGAFSPDKPIDKAIVEFLYYLPDFYKLIDLNISQKIDISGFRITERTNRVLDLARPYESIESAFTNHCRRNIETAEKKGIELVTGITPDELLDLFILNKGKELKDVKPRDYQRMRSLMNFCIKNKKGRILGIRSGRKKLIFGLFLIETSGCKTIELMSGTRQAIEKHLDHFSLNEIIKSHAGSRSCLDFAINESNGDVSFADSFGAEIKKFYRIYRNRLLVPARILR